MASARVLVVDDERSIVESVTAFLTQEGYTTRSARDGAQALTTARSFDPQVVILDVMLPGLDGLEVLQRLRRDSNVYIIMLTARTEEPDKLVGLGLGADDYMTKPFSLRELAARVRAGLRRTDGSLLQSEVRELRIGPLRMDRGSRQVWVDERLVTLTAKEFELLWVLADNSGLVLSREQLLEQVWGAQYFGELRVVDVHIGHIRRKLGIEALVATVRGIGYRLVGDPQ